MPINNSGDQLLVRRVSGEAICELSKREPVVVFNKSLKNRVENTIWIKRRLHFQPFFGFDIVSLWVIGLAMPQKTKIPDSWSRGTLRLNSPPPSAARFLAYDEPCYIEMALMGDMVWKSGK
jgi:hypothetical protein